MKPLLDTAVLGLPFILTMFAGPLVVAGQAGFADQPPGSGDLVLVLSLRPSSAMQTVVTSGGALIGPSQAPFGFFAQVDAQAIQHIDQAGLWYLPAAQMAWICGFEQSIQADMLDASNIRSRV